MDARDWDDRYAARELIWTDRPNEFLVRETEHLTPTTALDLACGEGRNSIWLAEHGWSVTGADFSAVALSKARQFADERDVEVSFEQHDAVTWEPSIKFGLVAVLYLQLPSVQRATMLQHAIDAVADAGTFLVVAHDLENLTHGVGGPPSSDVLYRVAEVVELVTMAGFTVITAEQARREVATPEGSAEAIDTVVRAQRA
jgi:SAM-dependent methyltransferase